MEKWMKSLEQPDRVHLNAASGWLGLGNYEEAHNELEQISNEKRTHPAVLLTRCEIYMAAKKWDYVISIAETLMEQLPKLSQPWIFRSYALHALNRTQEAFELLLPAAEGFPKLWIVRYNLACYCSRLGRIKEAMGWLEQAIDFTDEEDIRQMALDDPDLEPLWAKIGEI
jgi:tetratricopeptide (TPR) repeat protein